MASGAQAPGLNGMIEQPGSKPFGGAWEFVESFETVFHAPFPIDFTRPEPPEMIREQESL